MELKLVANRYEVTLDVGTPEDLERYIQAQSCRHYARTATQTVYEIDKDEVMVELARRGIQLPPNIRSIIHNTRPAPDNYVLTGLYPFQAEGVIWLSERQRAILGDEQGLGKTVQIAALLASESNLLPALVVCPAHLQYHWERILQQWTPYSVGIAKKTIPMADIVIQSYNRFSLRPAMESAETLILDESHYIKNRSAARSQRALGYQANQRYLLTGTPLLNRVDELWTQLRVIGHRLGRSETAFLNEFTWYSFRARRRNPKKKMLPKLRRELEGWMLRRLKDDVLDELPQKTYIFADFDANEQAMAEEKRILSDVSPQELFRSLQSSLKNNELVHKLAEARKRSALAKAKYVNDYVKDLLDGGVEKVVVWWYHRGPVNITAQALASYGVSAVLGGMTPHQRHEAERRFCEGDHRVYVATIMASKEGVNLQAASTAVFGELDWVPGNLAQATDRIHRIGQHDPCTIHWVCARGTMDHIIASRLYEKQEVIDGVIGEPLLA